MLRVRDLGLENLTLPLIILLLASISALICLDSAFQVCLVRRHFRLYGEEDTKKERYNVPLSRVSDRPALVVEGCTVGPSLSAGDVSCWGLVRVEGGGGRVGYFRGVGLKDALAAEGAVLEAPEPIAAKIAVGEW